MFQSIMAFFAPAKLSRKAPRTKRKLGCERLETRDTPASVGVDDIARASKTVSKPQVNYEVAEISTATSKTIKRVEKRNTLTLKYLD